MFHFLLLASSSSSLESISNPSSIGIQSSPNLDLCNRRTRSTLSSYTRPISNENSNRLSNLSSSKIESVNNLSSCIKTKRTQEITRLTSKMFVILVRKFN